MSAFQSKCPAATHVHGAKHMRGQYYGRLPSVGWHLSWLRCALQRDDVCASNVLFVFALDKHGGTWGSVKAAFTPAGRCAVQTHVVCVSNVLLMFALQGDERTWGSVMAAFQAWGWHADPQLDPAGMPAPGVLSSVVAAPGGHAQR